ncbi:MAG: hypothetical protein WBM65_21935 [Sedimenticolaceae bacterium]
MHRLSDPNIALLERAVEQLGPLVDEMVFVGGCATGLLLTDTAAPPIRATQDVDALTEVATRGEYYRLSARLRARGFSEDQSPDAPLCRWVAAGVILDVMPTNPDILGFGNEWYEQALRHPDAFVLPSGAHIRVVTSPHFLATKLAAFEGRGNNDYVISRDIEDVVAVLDGRPEIVKEVAATDIKLQRHLKNACEGLLSNANFVAAVSGHLPSDAASQSRLPLVLERLKAIAVFDYS